MSTAVVPNGFAPFAEPRTLASHAALAVTPATSCPSTRPLLVAADGREDVRPAMRVAAAIAARLDLPVRVLAALAPMADDGGAAAGTRFSERELARAATVREAMGRRIRETTHVAAAWH
jgi:hypothetical protein